MSVLQTKAYWVATAERVISTTAASVIAVTSVAGNALDWNWTVIAGTAAATGIMTFLKCLAAINVGDNAGPSLTSKEILDV